MSLTAPVTEREIVERASQGDRRALEDLVRSHERRIAALCRTRLSSSEDTDDAVQETFARALARIGQLRDPGAFGPWLRTIAINVCHDHWRERARDADPGLIGDRPDESPSPQEVVEAAEDEHLVRTALDGLKERDRHALWLRHGVEAPISRVANELGVTEGSARVMLTRARKRLRSAASGLAALIPIPVSWRHWIREHAHRWSGRPEAAATLVPALAVAAVVMAPLPASPTPVVIAERPIPAAVDAPSGASEDEPDIDTGAVAPRSHVAPIPKNRAERFAERPSAKADDGPVRRVVEDLRVQEGYPEDERNTEIELDPGVGDPVVVRLYADPWNHPEEAVEATLEGVFGD